MFKICCIENCNKDTRKGARGMCGMHAQRVRRHGSPHSLVSDLQRKINCRDAQLAKITNVKSTTYRKFLGRHEHRVIAENIVGRPLHEGEIVHHIDGNKHNNNAENLKVMMQSEHMRIHLRPNATQLAWQGKLFWPNELAFEFGLSVFVLQNRLKAGWSLEKIANTPTRKWVRKNV